MHDRNKGATTDGTGLKIVLERTYRAAAKELWELWTTREGFESWWAPEGFRTEVHSIEARVNGSLHYDMIAMTQEIVQVMTGLGLAATHSERARFSEFSPYDRLVLSLAMDFLPGVNPYESTMLVELFPSGEWVRMVVTLSPMHSEEFTKMAAAGLASQLANIDKRLPNRPAKGAGERRPHSLTGTDSQ